MKKMNISILLLVVLLSTSASATKCLRAQTWEDLKKDFPVIARGKVVERKRSKGDQNTFLLKINVVKVIHGELKTRFLKATEIHYEKDFWKVYEVGKEYTFLVTPKGKQGWLEVTLPMDGCPELPDVPNDSAVIGN